jgi:rod shape-determining protein MreD
MRWIVYFILAYIAVGLQVGLAPFLRYNEGTPNFVLLAVIFISINAPREPALLGAFTLGLLQDLMSTQGLGVYAFSYGLAAMFTISTQEIVYREHPLTHLTLGLMTGLMTAVVLVVHAFFKAPAPMKAPFISAILTAAAAPIVLGVLQKMKRVFAFKPDRRRGYPY